MFQLHHVLAKIRSEDYIGLLLQSSTVAVPPAVGTLFYDSYIYVRHRSMTHIKKQFETTRVLAFVVSF